MFARSPIFKAALTSGVMMTCGDVLCQTIRNRASHPHKKLDLKQALRFGIIGVTLHGPYFYTGFRWLDTKFGSSNSLRQAITKTMTGQVTLFPVYLVAFFTYMGALEGLNASQCVQKVKQALPSTFLSGWVFWPIANTVNFKFFNASQRIYFVNASGLVWNAWMSYKNSTKGAISTVNNKDGKMKR